MAKVQVLCLPALPIIMLCYWFLFVYVFYIIAFDLYMIIVLGINEYKHVYDSLLYKPNRAIFTPIQQRVVPTSSTVVCVSLTIVKCIHQYYAFKI